MILKKLINDYLLFKKNKIPGWENSLKNLAKYGQEPGVFFIGCCDSRITPELMLDIEPGEIFIHRNIGNFVPPYKDDEDFHGTAAAIEYATSVLKVKHIIICGHSHCGACHSLYKDIPYSKSLTHVKTWLKIGEEAKLVTLKEKKYSTKEEKYRQTELNSLKLQLKNIQTYPEVKKMLKEKTLDINLWYYDIENGNIIYFNQKTKNFEPLENLK